MKGKGENPELMKKMKEMKPLFEPHKFWDTQPQGKRAAAQKEEG